MQIRGRDAAGVAPLRSVTGKRLRAATWEGLGWALDVISQDISIDALTELRAAGNGTAASSLSPRMVATRARVVLLPRRHNRSADNRTHHIFRPMQRLLASRLTALSLVAGSLLAGSASAQVTTVADGYQIGPSASLSDLCSDGPSYASFVDGSYLVFDGMDVEHRGASGVLFQRYVSFPFFSFPSFVTLNADETIAYFGESSNGDVYELDLVSGALMPMANLTFNFDMAIDDAQGVGYISAASAGFGVNSVHRIDLASFAESEVVQVSGFSGPIAVAGNGDVLLGVLPDMFPLPADATNLYRFAAADLGGATVLNEADGTIEVPMLDGLSSMVYDDLGQQIFFAETNSGVSGSDTLIWRQPVGGTQELVAETAGFAGGLEFQDGGIGTHFGPYQPNYTALTFIESDCFGTGTFNRTEIRGLRPNMSFSGPFLGNSGSASFDLTGGPANGFAALWISRSGALVANDVIVDLGGTYPIALRATEVDFGRRFPMMPLDAMGAASFPYFQNVMIEGLLLGQWLIYDANGALLTTSDAAINRSPF